MARLALLAFVLMALPGTASAAPLGEVPAIEVRASGECLNWTGVPGQIAVARGNRVRFVQASRAGFALGPEVAFSDGFDCAVATGRASGAGVIAGTNAAGVAAAVQDPGGAWSAPLTVATRVEDWYPEQVSA